MNDTIESLKLKIAQLEQENLCLRNLLDKAGISYNEEISKCCSDQPQKSPDSEGIEKYDVNQGASVIEYWQVLLRFLIFILLNTLCSVY